MHHPNRLKDKPRDQMKPWNASARRRRTIVLCHKCHAAHHGGRMTSGTESRVHSKVQALFGGRRWGDPEKGASRPPYQDAGTVAGSAYARAQVEPSPRGTRPTSVGY